MKITQHFSPGEFACPCCGQQATALALAIVLEDVREHFDSPVSITSGYRCEKHNASDKVKGRKNSKHLEGIAADIVVKGIPAPEVYHWLTSRPYADALGLGHYETFTHVDVRGEKARWRG